jgi:rhomboid protease GluP
MEPVNREEQLFWEIIFFYVANKNYTITYKSEDEREVLLEKTLDRSGNVLRIVRRDFAWANELCTDMESVFTKLTSMKKRNKKNLTCKSIYLCKQKPYGDYENCLSMIGDGKRKTEVNGLLISENDYIERSPSVDDLLKEKSNGHPPFLAENIEDITSYKNKIYEIQVKRDTERMKPFTFGKPLFTYLLLVINVIMFALLEFAGGSTNTETLIAFGAKYNPYILNGEWWRFITPIFLHIGFFHLLMNSIALFYLGTFVERMYGTVRFIFIYLYAGILGASASFVFNTEVSAGASGAIFGCFGAILYFGLQHRELFLKTIGKDIMFILGLNLILGFSVPMIDNSAHLGGLLGGFLAAFTVQLPRQQKSIKQLFTLTFLFAISVLFIMYGVSNHLKNPDPMFLAQQAQDYIANEEYEKAYNLLQKEIDSETETALLYFYLSYTEIQLGDYNAATVNLERTIQLDPDFHEAHYNLALVYAELNQLDKARQSIRAAVKLKPNENSYKQLLKKLTNQSE